MKGTPSHSLKKYDLEYDYEVYEDCEERREDKEILKKEPEGVEIDDINGRLQCMTLHKPEASKKELKWQKHGLWRQEQKSRVARLEKQLKARWELEGLIEEQLNRFYSYYNEAMLPSQLKDVTELLMPKWTPPLELASVTWMGDWRPSAILNILQGLVSCSSSASSYLLDSSEIEKLLPQLIHETRIEEAVIDEEMAEIQVTCILHLPFVTRNSQQGASALSSVRSEFKKIEQVVTKAQNLRFKVLEMVLKKMLNQTDAAEFLVAFEGIEDMIHQFAANQKLQKGPVTVPVKALQYC
ncbi:Transcription factor TGA like domain [Quillaja saponaria]|uniref:Transcription factor TGA like domain n=1 Tax=Quillaja saponaria TaxID=32244 RepID=A0AAD7LRI9_QUISA|nr:Transcription factor TGA like domain [Quillaja saponaria]